MTRLTILGSLLLAALTLGCHTINKTQGICDCDPPAVAALLQEPALPQHVCQQPNPFGPYAPPAPRMRPAEEAPRVIVPTVPTVPTPPPPVLGAPKVLEGVKDK